MYDMCGTWLAGNAGSKRSPKKRHLGTIVRYPVVTAVQVTYALTAVLLHVGVAVDTGHYVTIVKRPADWLVCDDAQVGVQQI